MLTVGLTGPSGAGKGTVASLFARYGVPSIDTDRIYHDLLIPPSACLDELVKRFGAGILAPDGSMDRAALAAIVFAPGADGALEELNRISHRYVLDEVRRQLHGLEADGVSAVLVDAPQLFESGFDAECGRILAVLASRELRLARIRTRDGLTVERATARLDAQKPDEFFYERADAVMVNDGEPAALDAEVRRLLDAWEVPYEMELA